jgi:hypothetical protein
MKVYEGSRVLPWPMLTRVMGWDMIGFLAAGALAAQQPLPNGFGGMPQVGLGSPVNTAYYCKITGTLGPDGRVVRGSTSRPLSVLVAADPSGALRPIRTIDPSWLLNGKHFTIFRKHFFPSAYSAVTSLGSQEDPNPILLTLQPLGTNRTFGAVIGPLKDSKAPELGGFCSSNEDVSPERFEKVAVLFGAKE